MPDRISQIKLSLPQKNGLLIVQLQRPCILTTGDSYSSMLAEPCPLVTVALCSNRVDRYLQLALSSILDQTYINLEVLLVLNGAAKDVSEDELRECSRGDPRVRFLRSELSYLNHSLNIALDNATGEFFARMDADDISFPDRIQLQVRHMLQNPSVVVCGTAYMLIDQEGVALGKVTPPITDKAIRRQLYYRNPICHPTVMLRRSEIISLGGYLGGVHAEDYDLWLRVGRCRTNKFVNLEEPLLAYRKFSLGTARRSAAAYSTMAGAQWSSFVMSGNAIYGLTALLTLLKRWIRARQ